MDSNGCRIIIESNDLKVSRQALAVMRGQKKGSIYVLQGSMVIAVVAITEENSKSPPCLDKNQLDVVTTRHDSFSTDFNSTKFWQMQLGHMSEKGMTSCAIEIFSKTLRFQEINSS